MFTCDVYMCVCRQMGWSSSSSSGIGTGSHSRASSLPVTPALTQAQAKQLPTQKQTTTVAELHPSTTDSKPWVASADQTAITAGAHADKAASPDIVDVGFAAAAAGSGATDSGSAR